MAFSEPAFPFNYEGDGGQQVTHQGMSLRDWFAGQAIASIPNRAWDDSGGPEAVITAWARCAYAVADAMLKARETPRSPQENASE